MPSVFSAEEGAFFCGTLFSYGSPLITVEFAFANPSSLKLDEINRNHWPCDSQDRPLVFHPLDVYKKLPPNAAFTSKAALATALIELSKSIHYQWVEYGEEMDDAIQLLKQYIQQIYKNYGNDEVQWVIEMACLTAPSCIRMLDYAANDAGIWSA